MKRTSICKVFILASLGVTLAACAWDGKGRYQVVQVSYDYDNKDQSAHEWRAFMDALDRCHLAGYQDAQLASQSQRQCKAGGEGNCSSREYPLQIYVNGDSAHNVPACAACHGPNGGKMSDAS